jgi:hypothetical protein
MSTELSAEELALQESQKAVEAEALARAEAEKKQWGDQSGAAAVVQPAVEVDPAAADPEAEAAAKAKSEAEAKAKAEAEAAEAEAAKAKASDPHAAIVAFRKQNQSLLAENLKLAGMVEALKSVQQPAAPAAKAVEVDPLDAIAAKRVALAEQADTGDITLAEMRRQDMVLEREARDIELKQFLATQTQAAPRNEPDLSLEQATKKLAEDYPILNELSVAALSPFKDLAYAQAEREGTPIQPGALGTLDLRTRMAKLATKMFGAPAPAAPAAVATPAADDKAAALAAKIELQNGMPPDAHKLGNANTETGMTEAELTRRLTDPNLTYEESAKIMATVSPALRAKLGI